MNPPALDPNEVSDRLHAALDNMTVTPPPAADLHRAIRVKRHHRLVVGGAGTALLAAAATTVLVLASSGQPARHRANVEIGTQPSSPVPQTTPSPTPSTDGTTNQVPQPGSVSTAAARALPTYLAEHGGTDATGPVQDARGIWAADVEGGNAHVLSYTGGSWRSVADPGVPLAGVPIAGTAVGLSDVNGDVSFLVDSAGADSSPDGILVVIDGGWQFAGFDCGTTTAACAGAPGATTSYQYELAVTGGVLRSSDNNCSPSCAGGTTYDVAWAWNPTVDQFDVASAVPAEGATSSPTASAAQALTAYAQGQDASRYAGPYQDSTGTWAADVVGDDVNVLTWGLASWKVAATISPPGGTTGDSIVAIGSGPTVAGDGTSFRVGFGAADAVQTGIIVRIQDAWQYALFAKCGLASCTSAGGNQAGYVVPDAVIAGGYLQSHPDNCTPSCAGGTTYTEEWSWDTAGQFDAVLYEPDN